MSILDGVDPAGLLEYVAGHLTLWFFGMRFKRLLQLPKRIQWFVRLLTTTVLLLGVLWQNGSWTVELSNALEPAGVKNRSDSMGCWSVGREGILLLWLSYIEKRESARGLVFVRHSLLLLLCSVIVEALRYKDMDVSMYWFNGLLQLGIYCCGYRLDTTGSVFQKWTPEHRWTSPVLDAVASRLNLLQSLFDALEKNSGLIFKEHGSFGLFDRCWNL